MSDEPVDLAELLSDGDEDDGTCSDCGCVPDDPAWEDAGGEPGGGVYQDFCNCPCHGGGSDEDVPWLWEFYED